MKLISRLRGYVLDPSRSFRERAFVVLTITAVGVAFLALLGDIIYGENIIEILVLAGTVVITPITTYIGVRTDRIEIANRVISLGVIFLVMPAIFFFGGGLRGGSTPWLIFTYLYIGLILSGWWRVASIAVHTLVVAIMFYLGYRYPQLVISHSEGMYYVDLALAVIEVGLVCFIMTWFQTLLYNEENRRAREETKKVEDLNQSQNRFFSSMSHEIRTPINSILGLNEIILRQDDASDEIIKDASNIQGAGRMLLSLINDILDFSKIEGGKMDIVPVNYSVSALVSEIVNMIWLRAEQKGLELRVEVDPSIPAELYGDEVRIKQILVNLLNNAVKYTQEGSVTLHIEREEMQGDQIVLMFSVVDTGMGIKQDVIPYLFDAFRRLDEENNTKIEGTGLGLSIVKQLVELMDGRITVNSVYTQGSTFMVTLRQKVARADAVGEINISGSGTVARDGKYKPGFTAPDARVLIVDDNEMNLEVEKKLLDGTGISVDTVVSGKEAIALTMENNYDIILMDHLMPEMDGIECMQHIRKQVGGLNNRVPIIVLTANAESENKELYSRSGFDDYLVKPVSGRQLEEALIAHISSTKVIRSDSIDLSKLSMNTARTYSRKIPVVVAVGSMCDLPVHTLRDYQLDVIPFVLRASDRVFYDSTEAGPDELLRYMSAGVKFTSEPPSVEAFEKFFGKELKKAHNIIYISGAEGLGEEFTNARAAARIYGNVSVIDSGNTSSAIGMLALLATRMATQGDAPEKIVHEVKNLRDRINSSFVTDGAYFLFNRGIIDNNIAAFIRTLNIRPCVRFRGDRFKVEHLCFGDAERCYSRFVEHALPRLANPDLDVIFVVYVDLTDSQLELIATRIRRRYDFKNIIFQKASAVLSLHCGPGAVGLVYFNKSDYSYNLSNMLVSYEGPDEDEVYELPGDEGEGSASDFMPEVNVYERFRSVNADKALEPLKWYEQIDGLDGADALKNSGSEEALDTVLKIFYDSIPIKSAELQGFFDAEDWDDYTIKIHALKSSARLVGANKLADDAFALEMAGKEGRIDYIREHHGEAMDEFKAFYGPLSERFKDMEEDKDDGMISDLDEDVDSDDNSPEKAEVNQEFDRFLIESIYEALRDGAKYGDENMLTETLAEAAEYEFPPEDEQRIAQIRECLEAGDFERIIEITDSDQEQ